MVKSFYFSSHQQANGPSDVQSAEITIMLTGAQEDDGDACGKDHTDQGPYHVTYRVAFTDDEAV